MKYYYPLLLLSVLLLTASPWKSVGKATRTIEEFWLCEKESGQFLPAFKAQDPDKRLIGFYVGLSSDDFDILRICVAESAGIWVNNRLHQLVTEPGCQNMPLAGWRKQFGKDSVFVVLHGSNMSTISVQCLSAAADSSGSASLINLIKRTPNRRNQFIFIFSMIFLALIGFFRLQFPRIFRSFLDFNKLIQPRGYEEVVSGFRLLSGPSLIACLLVAMLAGFFFSLTSLSTHTGKPDTELPAYLYQWLVFSSCILGFLLARRLLIRLAGSVFQLKGAVQLQVFEYLRSLFLLLGVTLICFLLFFYIALPAANWLIHQIPLFITIFITLTIILLFYKLQFETRYQKLHLFSYLCATEVLPAILMLKIASL